VLAAHLFMDAPGTMFASSNLVLAGYSNCCGATSSRAHIDRGLCLRGGLGALWDTDKGLDKGLWIVVFLLVASALLPKKIADKNEDSD